MNTSRIVYSITLWNIEYVLVEVQTLFCIDFYTNSNRWDEQNTKRTCIRIMRGLLHCNWVHLTGLRSLVRENDKTFNILLKRGVAFYCDGVNLYKLECVFEYVPLMHLTIDFWATINIPALGVLPLYIGILF